MQYHHCVSVTGDLTAVSVGIGVPGHRAAHTVRTPPGSGLPIAAGLRSSSILLTLLGTVSLTKDLQVRAVADRGRPLLAGYLRSPAFFRWLGWHADAFTAVPPASVAPWAPELEERVG